VHTTFLWKGQGLGGHFETSILLVLSNISKTTIDPDRYTGILGVEGRRSSWIWGLDGERRYQKEKGANLKNEQWANSISENHIFGQMTKACNCWDLKSRKVVGNFYFFWSWVPKNSILSSKISTTLNASMIYLDLAQPFFIPFNPNGIYSPTISDIGHFANWLWVPSTTRPFYIPYSS
jgi:hypothetical protein